MAITSLTTAQRGSLIELYIAYFNRAPEASGLTYWTNVLISKLNAGQSQASAMTDISNQFYDAGVTFGAQTGYSATMTDAAFVTKIYENVLGRTGTLAPNAQEVNYWVTAMNGTNPAETGVTRATVIQRMLSDAKEFAGDPTWGWVAKLLENKTTVASFFANQSVSGGLAGADAVLEGKAVLAGVTHDPATVTAAINGMLGGETFTLKEAIVEGQPGTPDVKAVYWGYTPDYSEVGEGHGIPVAELLKFVTTITGLDLHELGLIDDDGVGPFDNVTNLKLEFGGTITADREAELIITFDDGTQVNAEVALGEAYFDFLNGLIFDEDGNSRLFEKVITPGEDETYDHQVPIKLTMIENNGGTVETGYTTNGNDTIVAGRLDLLHGAYIDAGPGYNLLEIDAKGAYAQPLQLLNIQEIHISDQPNFYTGEDYDSWSFGEDSVNNIDSTYPDPTGSGTDDSWIDLSRATKIQKLVVNDLGNYESASGDWDNYSGDLTIVGVRNGATLRLEGAFTSGSTNIHYGQGLTGELKVELALGDVTEDINIIQNAAVMNINSMGIENHMHYFFAGGSLSRMIVTGPALFGVDENLLSSFNTGRQAIIDASGNTGGLDVTLNGHPNVKITGTGADDEIESTGNVGSGSPTGKAVIVAGFGNNLVNTNDREIANITAGFGDDTITSKNTDDVLINAGDGANNINVDGSRKISITTGVGNDTIKANLLAGSTTASATINAGAGNNVITANSLTESGTGFGTSTVTITTDGGNDNITALLHRTATISAGDGTNTINVRASEVNVTTGLGNDRVTIVGMNDTFDNGDDEGVSSGGGNNGWNDDNYGVNAHFSDDIAPGALLNIALGAGTNTLNLGADRTPSGGSPTQFGVTALEGSTLTGTGIRIFVENHSDITNLDITAATITSVVLKQELRIMFDQFEQIGAAKFSVQFDEEGATEDLYIVVTEDTDMSSILDALPASVRVHVELHNGATLTIDAEDLHTHFAWHGIDATDGLNGKIVINNAGLAFNPFDNGANHQVIDGGSLSDNWSASTDVTINRTVTGFNRPTEDDNVDVTVLDSTGAATLTVTQAIVLGNTGNPTVLQIIGNQDIVFAPGAFIDLGDGSAKGNTIDFSALDGTITGMVVMNFDNLTGGIFGNSTGTRVEVGLTGDLGDEDQGLISSGVETIVVTSIVDNDNDDGDADTNTATIWLCDDSQDLELIGLQGNRLKTLTINEVPWGLVHPTILLEGDGSVDWDDVLKANGSPETSNIGNIEVNYYIAGAPANILIRNEGGADLGVTSTGTERKFAVGTITVSNAKSMNIDVEDGDATIADINGDSGLKSLDIDAVEDVTVSATLPTSLTSIDVSGVLGAFKGVVAPADDFTFVGAAGGSTLTIADDFTASSDTVIDGGAGSVVLIVGENADVDLSDASLIDVGFVVVAANGELHLTIDQALEIGPESIITDGPASLVLSGLGEEEFSLAAFDEDFSISVEIDVIDQTTVTLHPDTDLSGIDKLLVPEGVTLILTAAQFQQLEGAGAIEGVDGNDFTVIITDLDAASVVGGIDLSGITADSLTAQVSENVTLDDDDDLNGADLELADGVTLSLFLEQVDGSDVSGTNTTLRFLDRSVGAGADFDASGWSVDVVMLLNLLVANRNVDLILNGIQEGVEKVIYNGIGMVDGVTQTVTITEGTTIPGFVVFNPTDDNVEIQNFVLNMSGGTEISGNLRLSTTDKEDAFGDQIRTYLETVTINSTGTAENILSGDTANVITGDLTAEGTGFQFGGYFSIDNELLDVQITATQDLVIEGDIVFASENGDDDFSGNDDDEAVAQVLVNGSADVEFGIDSSDSDVDGVVVTNNGTGTVTVGMDDSEIDADDDLTFNGTGDIDLVIEDSDPDDGLGGSTFDLSDDDLSAVDEVFLDENSTVTVTLAQYLAIGAANFIPDNDDGTTATINIVGVGSDPFDATGVNDGVVIGSITTLPGNVVLAPTTNLTGVTMIIVPEGGSVTLSATQYQQLFGSGTIVGVEADGDPTSNFTVNITGLTQALVNHNESAANGNGDGFDITGITANTKTITLGQSLVTLTEADVDLGDVSELEFILATGQELVFTDVTQVSPVFPAGDDEDVTPGEGVTVTGGANTTATFMFSTLDGGGFDGTDRIDASGINVATLKLLNTLVDDRDVELLQNIGEEVLVVIFSPIDNPGDVAAVDRVVIVEPDVTVAGFLVFNDYQLGQEVRTLDLTLQGDGPDAGTVGAVIDGNLRLTTTDKDPDLTQHFLDSVTIRSTGTGTNRIDGDITPFVGTENTIGGVNSEDNELLDLRVVADTALVINGDARFSSLDDDGTADTATFTVGGTANVTVNHLDISESFADDSVGTDGIGTLVIANNLTGTGTLTVLGGTPAILGGAAFETLTITGTGATVLGVTDDDVDVEDGVESATLSTINASGSSGSLTINMISDVDSRNFTFTSGTGVTDITLDTDVLNETATADTGWTFNYTLAAAGSELHIGSQNAYTAGQLTFTMGANGTLFIDNTSGAPVTVDLTDPDVFLAYSGAHSIVLADGVTLLLRADQADGLNIIAGPNTNVDSDSDFTGVVNIVGLENDEVYDFGGIIPAGTITLAEDDVTVEAGTDLGTFSITLQDLDGDSSSLDGQTIRFSTEVQAARVVDVVDTGTLGDSSANVVWLFETIVAAGGVDTSGYDAALGRLWFSADLLAAEGGLVESLFTTLPSTILRVDFADLTELDILLQSQAIDRVMEIVHFVTVGNLTFSDIGIDPEEHLHSLTLHLGGETVVGDILVNDVVADPANTDLTTIDFTGVTIVSHRAVQTGDLLASELFVNDNDGTVEVIGGQVEHAQPDNINTVDDIGVGAGNSGIDLVLVSVNTLGITTLDDGSAGNGAAIDIGTITYGYTPGVGDPATTGVTLDVTGANDINIEAVVATDPQITAVTVDSTGFTGVLTAPGASPAVQLGANVETLTFKNGSVENDAAVLTFVADDAESGDESITVNYVAGGVAGSVTVDADDVNLEDANAIGAFVAAALDSLDGITATNVAGTVTIARDFADPAGISDFVVTSSSVVDDDALTTLNLTVTDGSTTEGGTIILGSATNAGIVGAELSLIDANDSGADLDLGIIASLDGTGTDGADAGSAVDSLTDTPAFTFDSGTGLTTLTIDAVTGQGTPTLAAGSTWVFDMTDAAAGSTVTIGDGAVINDGAFLVFNNATVKIDGNVDLSDVNLVFDDGVGTPSQIWIPAGQSLTLDVDQLDPSFVRIFGSGTLRLVGDASNDLLGTWIEVVNVDLSAVTIITDNLVVGNDGDDTLAFTANVAGAEDDDGNTVGFVITGSTFSDGIDGSDEADTINGATGNDALTGNAGSDTFLVTSGTDNITDLFTTPAVPGPVTEQDVLVVSAGATAVATLGGTTFVATAVTINNGTATINGLADDNSLIDVSLAGGLNGFSLNGGTGSAAGLDTIIGSARADTIDGGNSVQNAGSQDTLTGNAGADVFHFQTTTTSPATLAETTPTTIGVDSETITVAAQAADEDDEVLTINYTVNNISNAFVISDASLGFDLDFADENAVATQIAIAVDAISGADATIAANVVTAFSATGTGSKVDITGITMVGTFEGAGVTTAAAADVVGVRTITVTGTAAAGEKYNLTVQLADLGEIVSDEFTAAGAETADQIATAMAANFNAVAPVGTVNATVVGNVITLTDENADNGGFTILTLSSSGAFGGSGASVLGAGDSATAELITDFVSGTDKIDLDLAAGVDGVNYTEAAVAANYGAALVAANAAMTAGIRYYLTSLANDPDTVAANDQIGLLFFDANLDGNVDGVIKLAGISSANFAATDIQA